MLPGSVVGSNGCGARWPRGVLQRGRHDLLKISHGKLNDRTGAMPCANSNPHKSASRSCRFNICEIFWKASLPDCFRECAVTDRALASNLVVFGRGLAAIGNLFVFHRLSFVERRKTSFLDRRNMNKNVLAATGRLDESKTLGRVEPLHSTFSHHVVSAGAKILTN